MIRRHDEVFVTRVFTEREVDYCRSRRKATEHFAAGFAAKEAVLKSLGTKPGSKPNWTEIEIVHDRVKRPRVALHGATREWARGQEIGNIFISLSHCRSFATAYAVAVKREKK